MNIYEALKTTNSRISYGFRWLIITDDGVYLVFERRPYAKKTTVVYEGTDESAACQALLEG